MQYIIDDVNYDANYESRKLNRCNDKIRDIAFDLKTLVVDLDRFRDDFPELTDEEFENMKLASFIDIIDQKANEIISQCRDISTCANKLKSAFCYAETR